MNGLFAQIPGVQQVEQTGEIRQFKGDGTAFLLVPGLKDLHSIRIGIASLPLMTTLTFPASGKPGSFVETEWPTVAINEDAQGDKILMRAQFSNDGIWQDGATIYITGEWEPLPVEAAKPGAKKAAAKPQGEGEGAGTGANTPAN